MTDRIHIGRIAVYAFHGLLPEEEKLGQRFFVSLDCMLDLSEAGRTDDYSKTVCYQKLAETVVHIATEKRFKMVEALAETIAGTILETFPLIQEITVRVEKPSAPVPVLLDSLFIEIHRFRHSHGH